LLRDTTAVRLKSDPRFAVFETIKDFESHLLLTKQKLTNEFISKILHRAKEKFFLRNDPTCLWKRDNLRQRIEADFEDYFRDVSKSEERSLLAFGLGLSANKWTAQNNGFWLFSPEFVRVEGEKTYHWSSSVLFVESYFEQKSTSSQQIGWSDLITATAEQRGLFLRFAVTWSARIKDDARFHDVKVEDIKLVKNEFRQPTADELKSYVSIFGSPAAA